VSTPPPDRPPLTPERVKVARDRYGDLVARLQGMIRADRPEAPDWSEAHGLALMLAEHCQELGELDPEPAHWTWPAECRSLGWSDRLDYLRGQLAEPMTELRAAVTAPFVLWDAAADDARVVASICAETVRAQDPAAEFVPTNPNLLAHETSYALVVPGEPAAGE
jgi:hypothetical protein